MKILNSKLQMDLKEGNLIRLDLGSGQRARKGFYSVDHIDLDGIDVVADLNKPLNLIPDDCVEYIFSNHAFEHIDDLLTLMREIYRITIKNGTVEIVVPHFSNIYGYSDPTHVRFFGLFSMYYFVSPQKQPKTRQVPAFYTDVRFNIQSINIEFYKLSFLDKIFSRGISKVINQNIIWQEFYERRLASFYHARQIRYIMDPDK